MIDTLYDYENLPDGSWKCSLKPHVRILIEANKTAKRTGKKVTQILNQWEQEGLIVLDGGECLES